MGKKVLSPSELIEFRARQKEEEEIFAAKLKEENKLQEKLKRILSPSDLLDPKQESGPVIEEVIEFIEKIKDPIEVLHERIEEVSSTIKEPKYYDKEISQVNTVIEEIKKSIPKVPEVKYYDREIQSIIEKLDSLDIRYYESDIQFINDRLNKLRDFDVRNNKEIRLAISRIVEDVEKFYELEILDPKETHKYIDLIKESFYKKVEDLKLQLSEIPEVKYYDDELLELKEKIESVRVSIPKIPEIPEVKYYDDELLELKEKIESVRVSIPKIPEIPEVKYYDDELKCIINTIEDVRSSIPELPEVRYYENEIFKLEESIKDVETRLSKIHYYDEQINELNESIKNVENKIPIVPKLPKVKYYDNEISELNNILEKIKKDIYQLQKSVDNIEIPEQIDWSIEIENIYEQIEKLKEVPVITESTDPLIPLDQNFVTLDDLQSHYKLFINRIQQQLSTLGGGGETRLEFLDDIDRNTAKTNNYYLKYDASLDKWVGDAGSGGGGGGGSQTLDQTLLLGNTSSLGMNVGVVTATSFVLNGGTISSGVVTTTSISETTIVSLNSSIYRSATYQIQITDGTNYNMTSINVIHDGTTTYMTEYGTINQPIGIATFSTDINSGSLRLLAYPSSTNNTTFKVILTSISI
jgi:DNA repair ATPase RecN